MCFRNLQSRKKRFRHASNIKKVDVDSTLRCKQVCDLSWVSLLSSTTSKSPPPSFSLKPLRWYLSSFNFYFFNPAETASFVSWPISEGNGRHLGNVANYSQLGLVSCAEQNRDMTLRGRVSRSPRVPAYQRFHLILPIFGVGFLVGLGHWILVAELSHAKRAQRSTMGKKIG